jgi:hypothetical protein
MRRLILSLVLGLGLVSSVAWAQDFEAAGKHFSAAQEAFGAKHFKTAAAEFEAAYTITKDPVLLYNIAESYEKAGEGKKAVASYKAYLREQANAQDKAEVQRRIKTIEQKGYKLLNQSAPGDNPPAAAPSTAPLPPTPPRQPAMPPPTQPAPGPTTAPPTTLKEAPPTPPAPSTPQSTAPTTGALPPSTTPPPTTTPEPVPPAPPETGAVPPTPPPAEGPPPGLIEEGPTSKLRVAAWIGVAASLALLTAGGIFGLAAESRADEINRRLSFVDMNNQPHKFDQSAQNDLQSLRDDGHLYNGLAIGFYSAAGASAIVTVTMFIVDAKRGKPERPRAWHVTPVVGKDAAGFALGGSF